MIEMMLKKDSERRQTLRSFVFSPHRFHLLLLIQKYFIYYFRLDTVWHVKVAWISFICEAKRLPEMYVLRLICSGRMGHMSHIRWVLFTFFQLYVCALVLFEIDWAQVSSCNSYLNKSEIGGWGRISMKPLIESPRFADNVYFAHTSHSFHF